MSDWVIQVVRSLGYIGIALLTFLENLFPPIPSEVIMPLAGYIASQGDMTLGGAVASGSFGSLAGCSVWYVIGRSIGERRFRDWVDRHGRWITLSNEDVDKVSSWFQRYGGPVVFFGRLLPGLRTWISVPAGLHEMSALSFLLYSAVGTVLWTAFLTCAGYWLGSNFRDIGGPLGTASTVVFIAIAIWYIYRLVTYSKRNNKTQ
jgi:membrane protein DedA with SNARE-associated domain